MLKGFFVRLRPLLATLLTWFPSTATPLTLIRALGWWAAGWAFTGLYLLTIYTYKVFLLVGAIGFRWYVIGILAVIISPIFADFFRAIFAFVPKVGKVAEVGQFIVFVFAVIPFAFFALSTVLVYLATDDPRRDLALLAILPAVFAIDMVAGLFIEPYHYWKAACDFRRKFPRVYGIMASKSSRVQGSHSGGESTDVRSQGGRPLLDHPAMWWLPRINHNIYEWVIFAPPGRTLEKLDEVRDELSAQYPYISDEVDSIELVWKDKSKFASSGFLVVKFKKLDWSNPLGAIGGPKGKGWPWNKDKDNSVRPIAGNFTSTTTRTQSPSTSARPVDTTWIDGSRSTNTRTGLRR